MVAVALFKTPRIAKRLVDVLLVDDVLVLKRLVAVALVKTARIAKRLLEVALVDDAFVANKLVAVAFTEVRLLKLPLVALKLLVKKLVAVELPVTRLVIEVVAAVRLLTKSEVAVPCCRVSAVIVVVARVEVPYTVNVPEAEILPKTSAVNNVFSVHVDPFQYSVEFVAEPKPTRPTRSDQNVWFPLDDNTCPGVPVAPIESRNSPVSRSFWMVELDKNALFTTPFVAKKLVEELLNAIEFTV